MELKLNSGDVITIPDGCRVVIKDKIIAIGKEVQKFKDGKDWDADKKQIVDYKWKPKVGDAYYYIDCFFNVVDDHWSDGCLDNSAYNNGNCFKTKEEAQKYADKFIEILKDRKL